MFRSSIAFKGTGGDAPSKTLVCKYGAVLQNIGLECSGYSVSLPCSYAIEGTVVVYRTDSDYFTFKKLLNLHKITRGVAIIARDIIR